MKPVGLKRSQPTTIIIFECESFQKTLTVFYPTIYTVGRGYLLTWEVHEEYDKSC